MLTRTEPSNANVAEVAAMMPTDITPVDATAICPVST